MSPVFVPLLGFRPSGTRTLKEPAETTVDDTRLTVIAVAAAPQRTEVRVEWERSGDPASCVPGSRIVVPHSEPFDGVAAAMVIGTQRLEATNLARLSYSAGHDAIRAGHALIFPPLPSDAGHAELHVSEGSNRWRVALRLGPGDPAPESFVVEDEHLGVIARANAMTRSGDELVVGLEVEAHRQVRQVGAPLPTPPVHRGVSAADARERRRELRRVLSGRDRPITLHLEDRAPLDEMERLSSNDPQQSAVGRPFLRQFSVVFEAPASDVSVATLVIPFVDLNDFDHSVTVDLRNAPLDLTLGEHRFRVVRTERSGDQIRAELEVIPSAGAPRFLHPARMQATPSDSFSWGGDPEGGKPFWLATHVEDPPIVTFHGVVLRVDGPWHLELPLA